MAKRSKVSSAVKKLKTPKIGIIMGSNSDAKVMSAAWEVLEELNIPYEKKVVSAHRTPQLMFDYAQEARGRGLQVIIAGAGGAAHLPGMVASLTTLPVVGVPISVTAANGVDALFSIVQMPAGIPVACVAIDNAKNAGLLAAQILSIGDEGLEDKLAKYRQGLVKKVLKMKL